MPSNTTVYAKNYYVKNRVRLKPVYRNYKQTHRLYYKKYMRAYYKKNKKMLGKKSRGRELKRLYGISLEKFNLLKKKQNNRCKICNKRLPLCVDHSHKTGRVRSLVCKSCNWLIGRVENNKTKVHKILRYI